MPYIVIDGIDGAGKTTSARAVSEKYGIEYVHFPLDKSWFRDIDRMTPIEILRRFVEDFKKGMTGIDPGKNYIFDRSFVSAMIYQSLQISEFLGIDREKAIRFVFNRYAPIVRKNPPKAVILMDVDEYVALDRISRTRDVKDPFEKIDFIQRARENMRLVARVLDDLLDTNVYFVDTTAKSAEEGTRVVEEIVLRELGIEKKRFQLPSLVISTSPSTKSSLGSPIS